MTDQNHLQRIDAITKNARGTWFALLTLELFTAITLMRVEHIDFYGVDRATQLPILNIGVPTFLFFYAAPILLTATFGFFHIYLIRLWDALSNAPSRVDGQRLGDAVSPWLVTDAALHFRNWVRRDYCTTPRALDWTMTLLTFALNWGFGWFILLAIWWVSMPARDPWMTGITALCALASLFIGFESALQFRDRMKSASGGTGLPLRLRRPNLLKAILFILCASGLGVGTFLRTMGPAFYLAAIAMPNEAITQRPAGWLPYQEARLDYLATWCRREGKTCASNAPFPDGFAQAWKIRRDAALGEQVKPRWHKRGAKPNWTGANLSGAYLSGANLVGAQLGSIDLRNAQLEGAILLGAQMRGAVLLGTQMQGADLTRTRMQRADLREAQMEGANLFEAQMQGAVLDRAQMQRANLIGALMQGAVLSEAQMQGADLRWAQMEGARLSVAQMQGADLHGARMQGASLFAAQMGGADLKEAQMQGAVLWGARMEEANLNGAQMQGANLSVAQMEGANLIWAQMEGALFDYSELTGTSDRPSVLAFTNLSASINSGGALRFVNLNGVTFDAQTDFRNAFLDGSVLMTPEFRKQMGSGDEKGPCQWAASELYGNLFYGRWRGWLEAAPYQIGAPEWIVIAPEAYKNVKPIPPPLGCEWKTGPMPGAN
ncbi:MAG: pentapeptide repeat-containing protein [Pseudomonadota bacterium]